MKISKDFGIVLKKSAVFKKKLDLNELMIHFNFIKFFDENDVLISLGLFLEVKTLKNA